MANPICPTCAGNGVFRRGPGNPGGINPAKPGAGEVILCTSCAGTGIMRTHTPL